ncbi:hypothetical protein P4475_18370 [Halalkalibacterium halodurans]|uniref:hypothetical protein n=1 Tax=Halalkalibacterium halodurans TaxID=86665 RepID=UPI0006A96C86|nr:hypothetical protein [Halalkalibacterium halodurans]MED3648737.1 hypothetical protein [Halalkalibacterium halodurans]
MFIKAWSASREEADGENQETVDHNMTHLSHPTGEAQLDFGKMEAMKGGELIDVHTLILILLFSIILSSPFPLSRQDTECLLYGLKEIF